jgi:chromosome segregation ATPase
MAKASRALLQAQNRIKQLDALLQDRNDNVRALSATNDLLDASQRQMLAENDQLREANERLEHAAGVAAANIKQLTETRDRYYAERETFRLEARDANKQAEETENNNVMLRDRLHQSELQVARLEGMLERVREFDPVSDRDVYEDGKPRHEPPPIRNFDGALSAHRPPRWYDRRRQVA